MAQAGRSFVPAWKRLGLNVKKGDQSVDTASDYQAHRATEQPVETTDRLGESSKDYRNGVGPTPSERPGRLGKRKHQDGPAEGEDLLLKKNKKTKQGDALNGNTEAAIQPVPEGENANSSSKPEGSYPSDKPRPKGDPNYRKKKGPQIRSTGKDAVASRPRQTSPQSEPPSESTLLPSTETGFGTSPPPVATPNLKKTTTTLAKDRDGSILRSSPLNTDRRKSVTFTPDTKTVDGHSAQNLFKKWATEQKDAETKVDEELKVSKADKKANKTKQKQKEKELEADNEPTTSLESAPSPDAATPLQPKGKKKDSSLYLNYLSQYYNDRSNWKFNKAKQNDVLENAFNIFRIPNEYSAALVEYVKGLKGAAVIERLKERCTTILEELDEADKKDETDWNAMNDQESRELAKKQALKERLAKEKKRRKVERDIEALSDHPYPDGYIRRLKRQRANDLLTALNIAVPIAPPSAPRTNGIAQHSTSTSTVTATPERLARKRKRRTEVSSDESSSSESSSDSSGESSSESSSSEESSSEESSSGDSSSEDGSSSEGSRNGGSDNESEPGNSGSDIENIGGSKSSESEREESEDSSGNSDDSD